MKFQLYDKERDKIIRAENEIDENYDITIHLDGSFDVERYYDKEKHGAHWWVEDSSKFELQQVEEE